MNFTVVTSPAELLTRIPVTTLTKAGELRLAGERLTFVTSVGEVLLDASVDELHSVAPAATGMHVWRADQCFRFGFRGENRHFAATWIATLTPLVGSPPVGLRVGAPWPKWAWMLAVLGGTLLLVVAIAALARLNS